MLKQFILPWASNNYGYFNAYYAVLKILSPEFLYQLSLSAKTSFLPFLYILYTTSLPHRFAVQPGATTSLRKVFLCGTNRSWSM